MTAAVEIPLVSRNGRVRAHALVDETDAGRVESFVWRMSPAGYATRGEAGETILLHRFIMGVRRGDPHVVDHINRCRLDNRRVNLRVLPPEVSLQNKSASRGSRSRFRGVSWNRNSKKWLANCRSGGQEFNKTFDSEVAAALAAQAWRDIHMPFAEPDPELADIWPVETDEKAAA
jgi:hypothetical protein